jgi:hypothetical protein
MDFSTAPAAGEYICQVLAGARHSASKSRGVSIDRDQGRLHESALDAVYEIQPEHFRLLQKLTSSYRYSLRLRFPAPPDLAVLDVVGGTEADCGGDGG